MYLNAFLWSNRSIKERLKGCIGIRFSRYSFPFFRNKEFIKVIFFEKEFIFYINDNFFKYPIICNKNIKNILIEKNLYLWEKRKNPKLEFKIIDEVTLKLVRIL